MRRPDVFTLNYNHPLAHGLVFSGLGSAPGSSVFYDSSLRRTNGLASNINLPFWSFDSSINRYRVNIFGGTTRKIGITELYFADGESWSWSSFAAPVSLSFVGGLTGEAYTTGSQSRIWWYTSGNFRLYNRNDGYISLAGVTQTNMLLRHLAISYNGSVASVHVDGKYYGQGSLAGPFRFLTIGSSGGSAYGWNGWLSDTVFHNRALSPAEIAILADRTDPMLGGMIVDERPVLYFDMGGSTTDALTASDLVVGSPVLGTTPLGQIHALTATGITTSAPVLGTPALVQVHGLTATALTVSAPVLGSPAIGQIHALTATALVVGSPVLGTPLLTENAADVDALTAVDLVVGSPVLGTPSLGQIHVLGSDGLVTGPPVLGSQSITQVHTLEALGLTVGAPVLGTPALNRVISDPQVRAELNTIGSNQHAAQSFGTFNAEFQSYGTTRIELICIANFKVNELGE